MLLFEEEQEFCILSIYQNSPIFCNPSQSSNQALLLGEADSDWWPSLFFFAASHLTVFLTSLLNKHASCRILDRRVLRSQISDVFENIFTYLIKIRRNYRVNLQCVDFWFQNLASDQMLALTLEPWFHNINLCGQHCPNIAFQSFLETYCLCPTLLHLQSTGLPSFLQLCRVSLSKIRKISITFPVVLEMHCILFLITILPMIYAMLHKINFIKRFEACMAG